MLACAGILLLGAASLSGADAIRPEREPLDGIWISRAELALLPTSGPAWEALVDHARRPASRPDLADQDDPTNVRVLARALVYARTGDRRARAEVEQALLRVRGTEREASVLAVARELVSYVIAADLIGLDGAAQAGFSGWLRVVSDRDFRGRSIRSTHEDRPNNWGTHAGATRLAIAIYLGDEAEVARVAHVFRGWLGEDDGWRAFEFGGGSWQATFFRRYAINPPGSTRRGHSIDGVLPDDQRRGGRFEWPPPKENYVYEALQGAVGQAVMLERQGYPVWQWGDRALERAFDWLHEQADFPAEGDDTWLPPIVNRAYGRNFPAPIPSQPGKGLGFSDWTHASGIPPRGEWTPD